MKISTKQLLNLSAHVSWQLCYRHMYKCYCFNFNAPVPLAGDATALVRHTKKWTDTQQDRRDGSVEHLRRYYFACVAYQLRIDGAWVTYMRRIWRMNGDATAYDVAYENLTTAYSRRKCRVHGVIPRTRGGQRDSMAYGGCLYSA